ncbi:MAG: hypothetical protein PUJ69_08180 [Porphyromonas somerae]|uniref:hypothetical protein n=1 Tax=Porphyromonas somerae TaxID=322095 RepID=UPI00258BD9DF|nr:hypothetical protein [Porphyromonas somerae]MDD7558631.1 hypothetical protein [Porphyromonas somerae]MDY3120275.1 hypothetical protein [Porphyromonas somerae]MDY5816055.1 hypothetical protein [Porphyromonas somerae]
MKDILTSTELSLVTGGNCSTSKGKKGMIVIINGKKYILLPNGVLIPLEVR